MKVSARGQSDTNADFVGYRVDPNTRVRASRYSDDILTYEEFRRRVQAGEQCKHCLEFLEVHLGPRNQCPFDHTSFERSA